MSTEEKDPDYWNCNGICLRGSDIGIFVAGDPVAYAHPDCPQHGN